MTHSHERDTDKGDCPITHHARDQLAARWPETVLRPNRFDKIRVPLNARLIGYDGASSAKIVEVPNTPMAAVVVDDLVVTFLTTEAARANIALRGYGVSDFERA